MNEIEVLQKALDEQPGDVIRLRGHFEYRLFNVVRDEVELEGRTENTVVTAGRAQVLKMIFSNGNANSFGWMAVGTGTTAPATGDTHLGSELAASVSGRIAVGTFDTTNTTSNPPNMNFVASWNTNQANATLGAVGLFNTASFDLQTMLARALFASTFSKTTQNTLTITYTISN